MGLSNWINAANSAELRQKVVHHCIEQADIVLSETTATGGEAHLQKRVDLARQVNRGSVPEGFYQGVTTNPTIRLKIDAGTNYDSDILFVVAQLWDGMSGYNSTLDV